MLSPSKWCYISLRYFIWRHKICFPLFDDISYGSPNYRRTPNIFTPNVYTRYNPLPMSGGKQWISLLWTVILYDKGERIWHAKKVPNQLTWGLAKGRLCERPCPNQVNTWAGLGPLWGQKFQVSEGFWKGSVDRTWERI